MPVVLLPNGSKCWDRVSLLRPLHGLRGHHLLAQQAMLNLAGGRARHLRLGDEGEGATLR